MNPTHIAPTNQRPLVTLGWAAFLACSWTWCIGMFLPALLIRDYGTWAWVIFALPNVAGAAAMGWVLQKPGVSERLVARHPGAMAFFSVTTILFHVLFVGWVVLWLGGWLLVIVAAGAALLALPLLLSPRTALWLSAAVLAGSVAAFVIALTRLDELPIPSAGANHEDLLPLALVCVLGFLLCPYLDLTFHRARQALSTYGSVAAFTLGFGAFFLAMIVFTLWYAPLVLPPDANGGFTKYIPPIVTTAIAAHMAGQSGFTVAAHLIEVARQLQGRSRQASRGVAAGLLFGGGIIAAALIIGRRGGEYRGLGGNTMSASELGYRLFLSFYGLLAPAYVWIKIFPWPKSQSTDRQRWLTLAAAVVLAAPTYWLGFIERRMIWLAAGVGIILLSRAVLELWARRAANRP